MINHWGTLWRYFGGRFFRTSLDIVIFLELQDLHTFHGGFIQRHRIWVPTKLLRRWKTFHSLIWRAYLLLADIFFWLLATLDHFNMLYALRASLESHDRWRLLTGDITRVNRKVKPIAFLIHHISHSFQRSCVVFRLFFSEQALVFRSTILVALRRLLLYFDSGCSLCKIEEEHRLGATIWGWEAKRSGLTASFMTFLFLLVNNLILTSHMFVLFFNAGFKDIAVRFAHLYLLI